jgi:uncharacterized protein HemX
MRFTDINFPKSDFLHNSHFFEHSLFTYKLTMNTVSTVVRQDLTRQTLTTTQKASVAYGWGVLILAGGGAYYFAKRSINADREERAAMNERRRQAQRPARSAQNSSFQDRPSPSQEGGADPAPVTHAQEEMAAKGKYEAAEPFRSRKGDRFS